MQKQEGLVRFTILRSRIMAGKAWWGERPHVWWAGTWGSGSQVTADRKQRGMEAVAQPASFLLFLFIQSKSLAHRLGLIRDHASRSLRVSLA